MQRAGYQNDSRDHRAERGDSHKHEPRDEEGEQEDEACDEHEHSRSCAPAFAEMRRLFPDGAREPWILFVEALLDLVENPLLLLRQRHGRSIIGIENRYSMSSSSVAGATASSPKRVRIESTAFAASDR
jgi:hypothetical protein